jgi:hypothetical protein
LAQWGVASALVALSKNDSKNIKELIARVLNAICKFAELRGIVVQQVLYLFFSSSVLMKQQLPGVVWAFEFYMFDLYVQIRGMIFKDYLIIL